MIEERIHLASVDSTNSAAFEQARADLDHGIVVVADEQLQGRGRLGREWVSPKGNLYCSILLPPLSDDDVAPVLSLVAANAVYEATACFIDRPASLSIKWPNDILIDGKKVAGILLEATNLHGRSFVVVGVGINIAAETINCLPAEIADRSTSLETEGGGERDDVLEALLERFESWYARYRECGATPVCQVWNQRCGSIGRTLEVPARGAKGTCRGVDNQGRLILDSETGQIVLDAEERIIGTM